MTRRSPAAAHCGNGFAGCRELARLLRFSRPGRTHPRAKLKGLGNGFRRASRRASRTRFTSESVVIVSFPLTTPEKTPEKPRGRVLSGPRERTHKGRNGSDGGV